MTDELIAEAIGKSNLQNIAHGCFPGVKKNEERVRYDSKSSGVGRITISAPVPDPQAQNAEGGQGGEDASSQPSSSDASQ